MSTHSTINALMPHLCSYASEITLPRQDKIKKRSNQIGVEHNLIMMESQHIQVSRN